MEHLSRIVWVQARLGACTPERGAIKHPVLESPANSSCICLTRRPHRERLKSCQIECDLQSAALMVKGRGVNCLAFSFYWGWIQAGRRGPAAGLAGSHPRRHPTVYTTRAECHKKEGAPFTGGPRAPKKRRPLDHSNYSIDIPRCRSGMWRTHQTLLFTRAPAANEAHWRHCASHLLMAGPGCQQQLSPPDRLPLSEPFIPRPTSDLPGYDISSPDLWSFLLADIQLLFPVFNSASFFFFFKLNLLVLIGICQKTIK